MSNPESVAHVLNRIAYGPRPADWERVQELGVEGYVRWQLEPEGIADSGVDAKLRELSSLDMNTAELYREYPPPQLARRLMRQDEEPDESMLRQMAQRSRIPLQQLTAARMLRAVESTRQLSEVLVDFWFNHFNVFSNKGQVRYLISAYERETIRPHVLGNFRRMLGAVARSPAMLVYLDNWQSAADDGRRVAGPPPRPRNDAVEDAVRRMRASGNPVGGRRPRQQSAQQRRRRAARERPPGLNENYARELLELHTLGVDGGYDQEDVGAVARALTGWTLTLGGRAPEAAPGFVFRPDWHDAEEKVVVGTRLAAGRGVEDGEQVLDILAAHPSTARHLAEKLCRRFVADDPPPALVDAAAGVFRETDGDLRATTAAVLLSDEFLGDGFRGAKVKSPLEFLASAARALEAPVGSRGGLARVLAQLGAPLYGASAPTGYPETAGDWTSANAILARMDAGSMLAGRVFDAELGPRSASRRRRRSTAADEEGGAPQRVDSLLEQLLPGGVGADTRERVVAWAEQQVPAPNNAEIASLILGSPEFQRC